MAPRGPGSALRCATSGRTPTRRAARSSGSRRTTTTCRTAATPTERDDVGGAAPGRAAGSAGRVAAGVDRLPDGGHEDRTRQRADDAAGAQREAVTREQADQQAAHERADQAGGEGAWPVDGHPASLDDELAAAPMIMPNRMMPSRSMPPR